VQVTQGGEQSTPQVSVDSHSQVSPRPGTSDRSLRAPNRTPKVVSAARPRVPCIGAERSLESDAGLTVRSKDEGSAAIEPASSRPTGFVAHDDWQSASCTQRLTFLSAVAKPVLFTSSQKPWIKSELEVASVTEIALGS
jgi:hypothetical protein